jgi:flagellar motor switch/type III secretory pathway protein FliN
MQRQLRIELGRAWLTGDEAARLDVGSEIPLDGPADAPIGIWSAGRRVARGALAVMDEEFCVRVLSIPACGDEADEGMMETDGPRAE